VPQRFCSSEERRSFHDNKSGHEGGKP
jgi:hypothetical protein